MSIVVIFEGQRKTIKVQGPNTLIQSVLNEAAEHFNLNPSGCSLRHKKSVIDPSQPYRFANLSNNAQVDLVFSASSSGKSCKIAMSVENGSTLSGVFDSSATLFGVLDCFVQEGKLPANVFDLVPEVVYLRSVFNTLDSLRSTTLLSLGLNGQAARLQLRFLNKDVAPSMPNETTCQTNMEEPNVPMQIVSEDVSIKSVSNTSVVDNIPSIAAPMSVESSESTPVVNQTQFVDDLSVQNTPKFVPNIASVQDSINAILQQNFDRVSLPALITITKYVINILNNPENGDKFLSVNCGNKVYLEKVAPCKGTVELLISIGFLRPPTTSVFGQLTALTMESPADHSFLSRVYDILQSTLTELGVEDSNRPLRADPSLVQRRTEEIKAVPFDPFKTNIVRTAQQPVRIKSQVEEQLEQLNKKRLEIEGNIEDVVRSTEALFPNSKGEVDSMPTPDSPIDDSSSSSSSSGAGSVPKGLINKILKKPGDDDAPLTTKAIRDLQKAQKARVYSRTLIRVRFPDRMCLQGYFHPRNTLLDVYQWILTNLCEEAKAVLTSSAAGGAGHFDGSVLELYTTPPRTVLLPFKGNATTSSSSLTDLQLLPAAVLYAGWNDAHPVVQYLKSAGLIDSPYANTSVGRYLTESLLLAADEKIALNSASFPVSAPLIPSSVSGVGSAFESGAKAEKQLDSSSEAKPKSSGKPKWFKI